MFLKCSYYVLVCIFFYLTLDIVRHLRAVVNKKRVITNLPRRVFGWWTWPRTPAWSIFCFSLWKKWLRWLKMNINMNVIVSLGWFAHLNIAAAWLMLDVVLGPDLAVRGPVQLPNLNLTGSSTYTHTSLHWSFKNKTLTSMKPNQQSQKYNHGFKK